MNTEPNVEENYRIHQNTMRNVWIKTRNNQNEALFMEFQVISGLVVMHAIIIILMNKVERNKNLLGEL